MDVIRRKVTAVIAVVDACTGLAVGQGSCRVCMENGREAAAKPGGFYVLTDIPACGSRILVRGKGYQPAEMIWGDREDKAAYVYLLPDRRGRLPGTATVLSGTCRGKRLTVISEREGSAGKLAADAGAGEEYICLYPLIEVREGRTFWLKERGGQGERITLREAFGENPGRYRLAEPLCYGYARNASILCNVYEVPVKDNGSYFLPIGQFPEGGFCSIAVDGQEYPAPQLMRGRANQLAL